MKFWGWVLKLWNEMFVQNSKATQINASLVTLHWANPHTNTKASVWVMDSMVYLCGWYWQKRNWSDLWIHTLLPSQGSSFSVNSRGETERNVSVGITSFLFLEVIQLIIHGPQHWTSCKWAFANSLWSTVYWMKIPPDWLGFNAPVRLDYLSWSNCADMFLCCFPPHHWRLSGSILGAAGAWRRALAVIEAEIIPRQV